MQFSFLCTVAQLRVHCDSVRGREKRRRRAQCTQASRRQGQKERGGEQVCKRARNKLNCLKRLNVQRAQTQQQQEKEQLLPGGTKCMCLTPAQQLCNSFFFIIFLANGAAADIPTPQPGVFGLMRLKSLSGTGCEWRRQLCVSHRADTTRGLQIQTKCRSILFCAVNVSHFLTPRTRPLTHFICRLYREYLYIYIHEYSFEVHKIAAQKKKRTTKEQKKRDTKASWQQSCQI